MHKDGRADIEIIPEIKFPKNYDEHLNREGCIHHARILTNQGGGMFWLSNVVDVICGFLFSDMKEVK